MFLPVRRAVCACAVGLLSLSVGAQPLRAPSPSTGLPAGPVLDPAQALERAWARAVAAAAVEAGRRQAASESLAARRPWAAAPALTLAHRSDAPARAAGERETEIGLAWPLWWPGQRAALVALAEAGLGLHPPAEREARWQLAGELHEAAWALHAATLALDRARQAQGLADALAADVARRVEAGELAPADHLAAEAEALDRQTEVEDLRQAERAAGMRWQALVGPEGLPWPAQARPEAPLPAGPGLAAEGALDRHPAWQLAQARLQQAEARIAAVRQSDREPPELSLGWRQEQPDRRAAGAASLALGLRIPFGDDARQRPRQAEALGQRDIEQRRTERLRDDLLARQALAAEAVHHAARQLQAGQARAARLRERARMVEIAVQAGDLPLPELLRARAAADQADAAQVRQLAALGLAQARHEHSLGRMP